MFELSRLPVEDLVRDLDKHGAVSLRILTRKWRRALLAEAEHASFHPARESIGKGERIVFQRMEVCDAFPEASRFVPGLRR